MYLFFYLSHTNKYLMKIPTDILHFCVCIYKKKKQIFFYKICFFELKKKDTMWLCYEVTFCTTMQYIKFDLFNIYLAKYGPVDNLCV